MIKYIVMVLALCSCAAFTAQNVIRTVLDVLQISCVLAARDSDEKVVRQVCGIQEAAFPALRDLLAGKAQARKIMAERRASDAGVDAQ